MWNASEFLDTYRSARRQKRREAVRAFRALTFTSITELLELYQLCKRDRSQLARLLLEEVRKRIRKHPDLSWRDWFALCEEHGLNSWIGRYAQKRFFALIPANASFDVWYGRWRYVITRPHVHFTNARVPPNILKRLLAGMMRTAKTLTDWRYLYDAPHDYTYGTLNGEGPHTAFRRPIIGADNVRRRAWSEIRRLLP